MFHLISLKCLIRLSTKKVLIPCIRQIITENLADKNARNSQNMLVQQNTEFLLLRNIVLPLCINRAFCNYPINLEYIRFNRLIQVLVYLLLFIRNCYLISFPKHWRYSKLWFTQYPSIWNFNVTNKNFKENLQFL